MLCSSLPFDSDNKKVTMRMTCEDPVAFDLPQWKTYSRQCKDLISKLLIKKPEDRLTLPQMISHPWFSKMPAFQTKSATFNVTREMKETLSAASHNSRNH